MQNYITIRTTEGINLELPVTHWRSRDPQFDADQPPATAEMNVESVELVSDHLPRPIRFYLESFSIMEGNAGNWSVSYDDDESRYQLEFVLTQLAGERARPPLVFQFDHERQEMRIM